MYSESTVLPLGRGVIENLGGEQVKATTKIVFLGVNFGLTALSLFAPFFLPSHILNSGISLIS